MRQLTIALLLVCAGQPAWADGLDGHHTLFERLAHQVFGWHHFPVTLILVVVGMLAISGWRKASTGKH